VVGAKNDTQPCSGPKLPASIIDIIIRVFATLGDLGAKQEANRIIKNYCAVQPASDAVNRVLFALASADG